MAGCEKYIEKMNAYLDGALPAAEISSLLEHMEKCKNCRTRFDALKIVSFEMRHMKMETPKDLHNSIMSHIKASKKPIKFAYARIFASVAAAAAITLFAMKTDVINIGSTFLFGAGADITDEAIPSKIDDGMQEPISKGEVLPFAEGKAEIAEPVAPLPKDIEEKPAQEQDIQKEKPAAQEPKAEPKINAELPATQKPLRMVPDENDYKEPFSVPKLATDETFAFYCIAIGDSKIPKEFPGESIAGDDKTGPIYIYIKNTDKAHEDAEAALQKAGFKIERSPANLPQVDVTMNFGLVVIFRN